MKLFLLSGLLQVYFSGKTAIFTTTEKQRSFTIFTVFTNFPLDHRLGIHSNTCLLQLYYQTQSQSVMKKTWISFTFEFPHQLWFSSGIFQVRETLRLCFSFIKSHVCDRTPAWKLDTLHAHPPPGPPQGILLPALALKNGIGCKWCAAEKKQIFTGYDFQVITGCFTDILEDPPATA